MLATQQMFGMDQQVQMYGMDPQVQAQMMFQGASDDGQSQTGEVRYDDPSHAQQALNQLDGSQLFGQQITVRMATTNNPGGTKLVVTGIPLACGWQELKDHFKAVGVVAYAGLAGDKGKGKGGCFGQLMMAAGQKRSLDAGGPMGTPKYAKGAGGMVNVGTVRFKERSGAEMSLQMLNGAELRGAAIAVELDASAGVSSQVLVTGLSDQVTPQDLIEYFSMAGAVVSAEVKKTAAAAGAGDGAAAGAGGESQEGNVGEVRYLNPEHAGVAIATLNSSTLQGATLTVVQDPASPDASKLKVFGLSPTTQWQELKDHFGQVGSVAYAGIKGGKQRSPALPCNGMMMMQYQGSAMPMQQVPQQAALGPGTACASVRFNTADEANAAVGQMNGMDMQQQGGAVLSVTRDSGSKDGTKIRIRGLPPTTQWQDLKDSCSQFGTVAFCDVVPDSGITSTGEIRYENPEHAMMAISNLNGSVLDGSVISVQQDPTSTNGGKLLVMGLSPQTQWQELKDHFSQIAPVAFAGTAGDKGKGKTRMGGMMAAAQAVPAMPMMQMPQHAVLGPGTACASVRFNTADEANLAVGQLNGMDMQEQGGTVLTVTLDSGSKDGTKIRIRGLPPTTQWQDLKDFCGQIGTIAFCDVAPESGATAIGEIRYDNPEHAMMAISNLNGSVLDGAAISVQQDLSSPTGGKLLVMGLSPHTKWQELKDHFSQIAPVAFAGIDGDKGKGKNRMVGMMAAAQGVPAMPMQQMPIQQMPMQQMPMQQMPMQQVPQQVAIGTGTSCAMVRFNTAAEASAAVGQMNGLDMQQQGGSVLSVTLDAGSKDGTKIRIRGLPPTTHWQDLKDSCSQFGSVAFCEVAPDSGVTSTGEIRYENPEHAMMAISNLNGSVLDGAVISVQQDLSSTNGGKLLVMGLSPQTQWQELKDHFSQIAPVAFAGIDGDKGKGKNRMVGMMAAAQAVPAMPMQQVPQQAAPSTACASVRFNTADEASLAVSQLNGVDMQEQGGAVLSVSLDSGSKDGTKIRIRGLPPTTQWQDLKDFCGQIGTIAFCDVAPETGATATGEIRYDNPEHAMMAISNLNGSVLDGAVISVQQDLSSPTGGKLLVMGLSPHTKWQELKDHFSQIAPVGFAGIDGDKGKGKNRMGGMMAGFQQFPCGNGNFNMGMAPMQMGYPMGMQMGQAMMCMPQAMCQPGMVMMGQPRGPRAGQKGGQMEMMQQAMAQGRTCLSGEVRYEDPQHAQSALSNLNGTELGGAIIQVMPHRFNNPNGTKILVTNLPLNIGWQELKDHFSRCGPVAFAATR